MRTVNSEACSRRLYIVHRAERRSAPPPLSALGLRPRPRWCTNRAILPLREGGGTATPAASGWPSRWRSKRPPAGSARGSSTRRRRRSPSLLRERAQALKGARRRTDSLVVLRRRHPSPRSLASPISSAIASCVGRIFTGRISSCTGRRRSAAQSADTSRW